MRGFLLLLCCWVIAGHQVAVSPMPLVISLLPGMSNTFLLYKVPVSIGQPPQLFHLLVDSGSSPLWLTSANASTPTGFPHKPFLPERSRTFRPNSTAYSTFYGGSSPSTAVIVIDGMVPADLLAVGGAASPSPCSFALIDNVYLVPPLQHSGIDCDGIIGFSLPEQGWGQLNGFWNLVRAGLKAVFALWMPRNSSVNGVLLLGEDDVIERRYHQGPIAWAPKVNSSFPGAENNHWIATLEALYVDGHLHPHCDARPGHHNCTALLDTGGGNLQLGGLSSVPPFAVKPDCSNINDGPTFTFKLAGRNFTLTSEDYSFRFNSSSCGAGALLMGPVPPDFSFGAAFLKNVFVVFDARNAVAPRIGFAHSHPAPHTSITQSSQLE
jgi:hypothetical protein